MKESEYLKGQDALLEKFKDLPLFNNIGRTFLKNVLELSKIRKYDAGEIITHEGVYDCWIYILISGKVNVLKRLEEIACLDKVGDTFGEISIIDGESRSATIQAVEQTVCLAVDASFIDRVEPEKKTAFYAVLYRLFAEIVANRLRSTSDELAKVKEENEMLKSRMKT